MGSWAGSAAAQTDDGGWFEGTPPRAAEPAAPAPGSQPAPQREPDYSPPPPDFQERAEAPQSSVEEQEVVEDDSEAQRKAVEEFSPRLAPYGSWVDDERYGRVWVPSRAIVGVDFVPYSTGGHWALTPDDAWIWVSDYPFGGITFHYGRWVWTSRYWAWVPGYVYAPAWVNFHVGAVGYIGWAPLAPRYVWRHGVFVSVGVWGPPPVVFCPTRYVFVRSMPRYVVRDHARVRSIAAQTRVYRSPRYLGRGPSPAELRIPRSALPERRVAPRRVIAEPQLTTRSRTGSRLLSESRYSSERRAAPYRREAPSATLPSRSRSYQTAPRSHSDAGRSFERPEAPRAPQRYGEQRPVQRGNTWGTWDRGDDQRRDYRRNEYRRDSSPRRERAVPQRTLPPQRSAPAVVPRERTQRSPYGSFDGAQRGAIRGGERSVAPRAVPRATPYTTPKPAPDARGGQRRYRRGDDSSSGDSRNRGRER